MNLLVAMHCEGKTPAEIAAIFDIDPRTVYKVLDQPEFERLNNAKKSLSGHQLARDLNLTLQTALYMQEQMARKTTPALLRGIIEMDETYIGGKPRRGNRKKEIRRTSEAGEQRKLRYSEP